MEVNNNLSLKIVNNDKIICRSCLSAAPGGMPGIDMIMCCLTPEEKPKLATAFCLQGLWLIDGELLEFKEAFKQTYQKEG